MVVERPYSVWESTDAEFLNWAIDFYLRQNAGDALILDATYGLGNFWRSPSDRFASQLTAIDIEPKRPGVAAMDNTELEFSDRSFPVIVYDPPHITDAGTSAYLPRYGNGGRKLSISDDFASFLPEAARVLEPNGIVLAKIADQVHGQHSQWHHRDFMNAAEAADFTVCDLIVKVRKSAINGNWKNAYHARKRHCFWIVLRKGGC